MAVIKITHRLSATWHQKKGEPWQIRTQNVFFFLSLWCRSWTFFLDYLSPYCISGNSQSGGESYSVRISPVKIMLVFIWFYDCITFVYLLFSLSCLPLLLLSCPADFQQDDSSLYVGSCSRFPVKKPFFLDTGFTWRFRLQVSASVQHHCL